MRSAVFCEISGGPSTTASFKGSKWAKLFGRDGSSSLHVTYRLDRRRRRRRRRRHRASFRRPRSSSDVLGRRADVPPRRSWQSVAEHRDACIVQACYAFHSRQHATSLSFLFLPCSTTDKPNTGNENRVVIFELVVDAFSRGRFSFSIGILDRQRTGNYVGHREHA